MRVCSLLVCLRVCACMCWCMCSRMCMKVQRHATCRYSAKKKEATRNKHRTKKPTGSVPLGVKLTSMDTENGRGLQCPALHTHAHAHTRTRVNRFAGASRSFVGCCFLFSACCLLVVAQSFAVCWLLVIFCLRFFFFAWCLLLAACCLLLHRGIDLSKALSKARGV